MQVVARKRSVVLLILAAAVHSPAGAQRATPDQIARVDAVFREWDSRETPGCAVGVSRGGQVVLERAYGMADLERGVANTPGTVFEAGSVSKQFTAAAVALLAEQGKLSLDDDVRKYVPELPDYGKTITIRHMLNHTAGLRDWGVVAGIAGWPRTTRVHTHEHVLEIVSRQRSLNYPVNTAYSYSNTGYNLAAIIVERVSGESLNAFMKRHFFDPLGMAYTQWRDDHTRIVKDRAVAYAAGPEGYSILMPFENVYGNGGLLTTVGDLLRWAHSLETAEVAGGRGLVEALHTRGRLANGEEIEYALGLFVGEYEGVREIGHTGSTAGYRAFLARYPDHGLAVALLCNAGNVNPGLVGRQVADVFLGRPEGRVAAAEGGEQPQAGRNPGYSPTAGELAAYAGEFHSDEAEVTIHMAVEAGRLTARWPGLRPIPLVPEERDVFLAPVGRIRFLRDDTGNVTGFSVNNPRVWDLRFARAVE